MVSAADPAIRFLSYEYVPDRARAAMEIFRNDPNVEVICGDAAELLERGPFDLLVHDGGPGSGKTPGSVVADPTVVLRAGGTMTIDDYTPTTSWPPMLNDTIDTSRTHWLSHPDLRSTEIQVAPDLAVVVCRYLPPTTQERGQYPASPLARRT
jgi:predicted O-methyltransferase YrrM